MAVPILSDLRRMEDQDLIEAHDKVAPSIQVGVDYYLSELARREQSRQTDAMLKYTCWITWMTFVVTVATAAQLTLAVVSFFAR